MPAISNDKKPEVKKVKTPEEKNKQDLLLSIIVLSLGIVLIIISLMDINIFPALVNYILAAVILIGGGLYAYKNSQPAKTETPQQLIAQPVATLQKQLSGHMNVHQLNQYVATLVQRGKKDVEIKDMCKRAGWTDQEITDALSKAKSSSKEDRQKQLETYIATQIKSGKKPSDVQDTLIKAGWKKDLIEPLIKKMSPVKK